MGNSESSPVAMVPAYPKRDSRLVSPISYDDLRSDPWMRDHGSELALGELPVFLSNKVVRLGNHQYLIGKKPVGSGGYGIVYAAKDMESKKLYAIKVMTRQNSIMNANAQRAELRVFQAIHGMCGSQTFPCLREFFSYSQGKVLVLVMDLINGIGGDQLYSLDHPRPSGNSLIRMLLETAETLEKLHDRYVSHGDIKPDNCMVMFSDINHPSAVALVDFGLSCTLSAMRSDTSTCHTQVSAGRLPDHMDPVYANGISNRYQADVYGLGYTFEFWMRGSKAHTDDQGSRGSVDTSADRALQSLLHRMQRLDPGMRPTVSSIASQLRYMLWEPGTVISVGQREVSILKRIGSGSAAIVFLVKDVSTQTELALKMQTTHGPAERSSQRELYILQELQGSPACERGFAVCLVESNEVTQNHQLRLLLEYYSGGTLSASGAIPSSEGDKIILALRVCESVGMLHSQGIAHLDLKGSNLLKHGDGSSRIVVTDFGLACSESMNMNSPELCRLNWKRESRGPRPAHIAPEIWNSQENVQNMYMADVFSLGVLFQGWGGKTLSRVGGFMTVARFSERPALHRVIRFLERSKEKFGATKANRATQ
jgi:serine/threonine protein kinase